MDKATIVVVLEKIATLLELKGENPFKIRAYTNAARSIEQFGGNLGDLKDEETLEKIPGIGKAIGAKIKELVETGSLRFFEDLRSEFPAEILELFSLPGLGAKKVKALYEQLGVSSIAQLQTACTAVVLIGYCLWAFEKASQSDATVPWFELSIVPPTVMPNVPPAFFTSLNFFATACSAVDQETGSSFPFTRKRGDCSLSPLLVKSNP